MIKKFNDFIKESYNSFGLIKPRTNFYLINESQESASQHAAIKLVMDRFGWDKEKANKFVRVDLRDQITPLRDKQIGKFTLGVARMYCDNQISDAGIISDLNATLKLLSDHLNEYDKNLNGLSAEELISKFRKNRANDKERKKREIKKLKFDISDYEIVKIDSFDDAKKYYKYTNPHSRWCLTHMEDMYDTYTCDGINQIYFCLKNGFEDIKPVVGENAPLDEYGLSMISIIVNENEELAYCTCRWNHDNGGTDYIMDEIEISKVVNLDFYETFKPNTKWKDMIDNAKQRLVNGESPKKIFDNVSYLENGNIKVRIKNKWNIINDNGEYLSDEWFDEIYYFTDGLAKVKRNKKFNFINLDGEIISDKWFYYAGEFNDGYAQVRLNNKHNFINKNGELISNKWFIDVSDFNDGCGPVSIGEKKWNYIKADGKYLLDDWVDFARSFKNEHGIIKSNGKYNLINKDGKILSNVWFDEVENFENGYSIVSLKGRVNYINDKGELLLDEWFEGNYADSFRNGYALLKTNGKCNFIDTKGKYLFNDWLEVDNIWHFSDGYAAVKLKGQYNFINTDGEYLLDKWYDDVENFKNGFAIVTSVGKCNYIDTKGKLISNVWFEDGYSFEYGYARVKLNHKWNFINKNGEYLSDEWFELRSEAVEYFKKHIKKGE